FGLIALIPGDAAAFLAGGESASAQRILQVREQLGLNDPFLVQYGRWLGRAVQGDFGKALITHQSVVGEVLARLPVTGSIVLVALVMGLLIGVPVGILAGIRPGSRFDRILMAGTTFGIAIPSFLLAMILVSFVAVRWHLLPAIGFTHFTDDPVMWLRKVLLQ